MILVLTSQAGDFWHLKFIDWLNYLGASYTIITGESILKGEKIFSVIDNNVYYDKVNLDNPYLLVYKTVLHLYNIQNNDCIKALEDWHIRNFSLNEWKDKWFIDNEFTQENIQINKHFEWCLTNDLNYAPVKIFNRKILPDAYDIDELFYFFAE